MFKDRSFVTGIKANAGSATFPVKGTNISARIVSDITGSGTAVTAWFTKQIIFGLGATVII